MIADPDAATFGIGAMQDHGAWSGVRWALLRDLRLAMRSRTELGVQLLFYVIVVSLFPLATTPSMSMLSLMGPGVLWVAALLASLLSLPRLFASDYADGTLEQIALSPYPLPAL
ncbi:MAG TPA: heme exporter protein CcmB, partial [Ktedonobacterales bacterium]|nr:heme exporter protein CcmB [Ktedonobacterales bacterium]